MLKTIIRKNNYQDSINLMMLTRRINEFEGVHKSQIMMGTEANKNILKTGGLLTDEAQNTSANDMVIVVDAVDESVMETIMAEIEKFFDDLQIKDKKQEEEEAPNIDAALDKLPEANLAVFSIPGEYAAGEMKKALHLGLNVFSFTDNISKQDEIELKRLAKEKGLLMMGPDCGTGILSGIPLAFTNVVNTGNISIVGASGTGIQEVSCLIDRYGGGIIHAIGTGGRDLDEEVNGMTMKEALIALNHHPETKVIALISKPPAKRVREEIVDLLHRLSKPVVAVFLGEKPGQHQGDVYFAYTLEECAKMAVDLSKRGRVEKNYNEAPQNQPDIRLEENAKVKGLYSGGTLGAEAAMLISDSLGLRKTEKKDGCLLDEGGYRILDLGDDIYTVGKPHPMIDPDVRIEKIRECGEDDETSVILLDIVLGYGTHEDMAGALLPAIRQAGDTAVKKGKPLYFIACITGTDKDIQNYRDAERRLREAGVLVEESNKKAVLTALRLKGLEYAEEDRERIAAEKEKTGLVSSANIEKLLREKPKTINIGLKSFNRSLRDFGGEHIWVNWKPRAGGNKKLLRMIDFISSIERIKTANLAVIEKMKDSQPFLIDVVPAKTVIEQLNRKLILHAGPPITYKEMTGPMQGSCIGAVLFEKWASDEEEAVKLLESGEIEFCPCHHVNAVGPMGGITTANMPVLVVKNHLDGTIAYCNVNEGIGKVLRFGAYSQEVIDRLEWMRDVLGPALSKALRMKEGGINLSVLIAKAITMGDEFHQRNIAASQLFLKEIAPCLVIADISQEEKYQVIKFLADTEQFFLNVMMATGKAIVDCARKIREGTVVTTLARNGKDFGVRIAGMGDEWFTGPVNTPDGLYFTGYSAEDANKDIGDSAITETVGVGGMAMIAAPGVTRFVGAGGFQEALRISDEMDEICISNNSNWSIPTWDFKGACLGIDAVKVVETGITPVINTGIAHKKAGIGQIGAGTVRVPLECFEKAVTAYAEKLGFKE